MAKLSPVPQDEANNVLWAGPYSTSLPLDNHQRQHFRSPHAVFLPVFVEKPG